MTKSLLIVAETEAQLKALPIPAPNTNTNVCLRSAIPDYEIIEPFETIRFELVSSPLTTAEASSIKRLLAKKGHLELMKFADEDALKKTKTTLLLAGLPISSMDDAGLVATNPDFDAGVAFQIPRNGAAEDDLIDEDELITEEDRQKPTVTMDCGPGTAKKACKDCSCGLAELEASGQTADTTTAKSSCGNVFFGPFI